jgi:hypothetical protein
MSGGLRWLQPYHHVEWRILAVSALAEIRVQHSRMSLPSHASEQHPGRKKLSIFAHSSPRRVRKLDLKYLESSPRLMSSGDISDDSQPSLLAMIRRSRAAVQDGQPDVVTNFCACPRP